MKAPNIQKPLKTTFKNTKTTKTYKNHQKPPLPQGPKTPSFFPTFALWDQAKRQGVAASKEERR